jgi:hypothetical protein
MFLGKNFLPFFSQIARFQTSAISIVTSMILPPIPRNTRTGFVEKINKQPRAVALTSGPKS